MEKARDQRPARMRTGRSGPARLNWVSPCIPGEGIALDEFKSFFFFLNNLEDFTIAVHYYSLANERILNDESL